jgi:glycosyltransferase involved in cell wall biosynthesis
MEQSSVSNDFTVITPVYNGEVWIEETLQSVLKVCEGFSFEYIVIDDGSTDGTIEILKKYQASIRIERQTNQGEASAVNSGLRLAKGQFIIIVSADDPMRSADLLRTASELLNTHDELVCVYPDWSVIDSASKVVRDVVVPEYDPEILIGRAHCLVGPGGVFRLDKALQIGGRDTRFRFTSDYDFWLRLSQTGEFRRIPGLFAFWREHEDSTSIALRGLEMAHERILVTRNFVKNNQKIPKKISKMASGYSYFNAAILVFFDKRVPAKRWLLKSLIIFPKGFVRFDPKTIFYILLSPVSPYILSAFHHLGLFRTTSKKLIKR